jgi:hypothetical protein
MKKLFVLLVCLCVFFNVFAGLKTKLMTRSGLSLKIQEVLILERRMSCQDIRSTTCS